MLNILNKRNFAVVSAVLFTVAVLVSGIPESSRAASPQTTAFTYQGQLDVGGELPSGQTYEFTFTLFDAVTGGNPIGAPIEQSILVSSGGIFTTDLDFGQIF